MNQELQGNCSPEVWNGNTLLVKRMVDLMYADEDEDPEAVDVALSICENCPALSECIDVGLSERYGVWGGLRASERRSMRQNVRMR